MIQKEITVNGKNYPVIFTLATLSNFEEITGKPFFGSDLDMVKNRIAIICAAALAADGNTELTVEELRGQETWNDYMQITNAYSIVMKLAEKFFPIPEVKKKEEPTEEDGKQSKN